MTWSDQRTRIRRFLRDPDGNIWGNAFLLRLYNDEQHTIQNATGFLIDVKVVRVHPKFYYSYMFDLEWAHTDNTSGEVFRLGYYADAWQMVFTNKWESEHLASVTPTTSAVGSTYTHPWEAWMATPAEPPPINLPDKFHKMHFIAFDKDPLEPITAKQLKDRDFSWRTRATNAAFYWRDEELSNVIYCYPIAAITWQDSAEGEADPDTADYATTDLDVDNNLLLVFEKEPTELSNDADISDFTSFIAKYVEYYVAARAYRANTDGRIGSLADYWELRAKTGLKMIKRFLSLRTSDRDYCLTSGSVNVRSRRHPRLPSAYPTTYP